ncbi:MAG TPA: hypothetical protein VF331_17790 [Polyangiales bacterium]
MLRRYRLLLVTCLVLGMVLGLGTQVTGCARAKQVAHKLVGKLRAVRHALAKQAKKRTRSSHYHTRSPKPAVPLGVNVSAVSYYATSLPFVDVMKSADEFQSTDAGQQGPWDTQLAERIPRDADRYPLELPYPVPGRAVPQVLRAALARTLYPGRYVLLYDGDGEFEFPGSRTRVVSRRKGRLELDVAQTGGALFVAITRSDKADHVRNVRVVLPGFEASYATEPFHPRFLERLRGVSVLRFMDWGRTNENPLQHWEERPTPSSVQGTPRGVALEYMIDLANRLDADAWLCVPHEVDDHYIEQMAQLVRLRLDPRHKLYLEHSNEVWNGQFPQHEYAAKHGCAAGYGEQEPNAGSCDGEGRQWAAVKWHAKRSADIFRIFTQVFGGDERLVRVLSGQAAYPELNEALLQAFEDPRYNPTQVHADALAIAPYFGGAIADWLVTQHEVQSVSAQEIAQRAAASIELQVKKPAADNKLLADTYGLRLVAYEGGQSLVATGPNTGDQQLIEKLTEANRLPAMGAAYDAMLDSWYRQSGGELMMLFSSVDEPGKFGCWGMLENQEQPPATSPKYLAFRRRLSALRAASAH